MGIKLRLVWTALAAAAALPAPGQAQVPAEIRALQWGLQNRGDPQKIAIDHYTSGPIAGVAGEDVALPATSAPHVKKIIVAVLDTGIDAAHPALKDHLAGKGYNFVAHSEDTADTHGHGTHVAGVVLSVNPDALILPVKVVQSGPNAPIRPQEVEPGAGTALTETVAKGIEYAIQNGAQVINLSLAWPASIRSQAVDQAVARARDRGVTIVSSAGNDSTIANVYPCIYASVICVGAHGPDGAFAYFSNYGPMVDVLAPGLAILSTWPQNKAPTTFAGQIGYEYRNGTSMASPFVAGAVAELLAQGLSPREARLKLILSARNTRTAEGSSNEPSRSKFARAGNLDLSRAIAFEPRAWIVPTDKAPMDLAWDGISPAISAVVRWQNQGLESGNAEIQIGDQKFSFDSIAPGAIVETPVTLPIGAATESAFNLPAWVNGQSVLLAVQIRRVITPAQNAGASVEPLVGIDVLPGTSVRSVVAAPSSIRRLDLLFLQNQDKRLRVQLVQDNRASGETYLDGVMAEQLLNPYRLPDGTYALIFVSQDEANRPIFDIYFMDSALKRLRKLRVGTDVTVLSESFRWVKTDSAYNPLWVSVGYTPKPDQPAYDPWNPKYQDQRIPRVYFVRNGALRTLKLKDSQTPLQVLPDGSVLLAQGDDYSVTYSKIRVEGGKIKSEEKIDLQDYQMLIGLGTAQTVVPVEAPAEPGDQTVAITAPSSPGNLRVTGIGTRPFDRILSRASEFESLVQVNGVFSNQGRTQIFAQTHYDLRFFDSASGQVASTSLNRYSYIPSMIFSRNFFPLVAADQDGRRVPAIYVAASVANANISEVLIADAGANQIRRPAQLRIEAPGCQALGNFIEATAVSPAQLVFICGQNLVKLPVTTQK